MFLILSSSSATSRPTGASSKTFLPPASPSTCSYMQEVFFCFLCLQATFLSNISSYKGPHRGRETETEREREQTSFHCLRLRTSSSCQSLSPEQDCAKAQQETLVLVPFHAGVDTLTHSHTFISGFYFLLCHV